MGLRETHSSCEPQGRGPRRPCPWARGVGVCGCGSWRLAAPGAGVLGAGERPRFTLRTNLWCEPETLSLPWLSPCSGLPTGHLSPGRAQGRWPAPADRAAVPVRWDQASRPGPPTSACSACSPRAGRSLLGSSIQRPHLALLSGWSASQSGPPLPLPPGADGPGRVTLSPLLAGQPDLRSGNPWLLPPPQPLGLLGGQPPPLTSSLPEALRVAQCCPAGRSLS